MPTAIALLCIAASFMVALGLRVRTKIHWFTAWLMGMLVLPIAMVVSAVFYPDAWFGVALFLGTLTSSVVAAIGVFLGWVIVRKSASHAP